MFGRLNRVLQLGSFIAWAVLVVMLWDRARNLALGVLAAGAVMGVLTLLTWRLQRRAVAEMEVGATTDARSAQLLVTRMLAQLTRVQVAYLGQTFANPRQGKDWLKQALPRGYRPTIDEMHAALEAARAGDEPDGLRLALRLHALRGRVEALDQALARAARRQPDADVAHPAAFVITEELALDQATGEPPIVLVAAWEVGRETLLPTVDQLTVIERRDGKKRVRGQVPFEQVKGGTGLRRDAEEASVYCAAASAGADLSPNRLPMGFLLSGSDLV